MNSVLLKTILGSALLLSCGQENSELKNVFGQDDRVDFLEANEGNSPVGQLETGCTGTLLSRDLVLTAAHCLLDPSGWVKRDTRFFRPSYASQDNAPKFWMESFWVGSNEPTKYRMNDWAIVKLAKSVPDNYGTMELKSMGELDLPLTVSLSGYSSDYKGGHLPQSHTGCEILEVGKEGRLLHDCDATAGISGGAIYTGYGENRTIVALAVSEYLNGGKRSSYRDQWTPEDANVGIPVDKIAQYYGVIQERIANNGDMKIDGIYYRKNPNRNPEADEQAEPREPQPVPGEPQPDPREPQPDPREPQPDPREPQPDPIGDGAVYGESVNIPQMKAQARDLYANAKALNDATETMKKALSRSSNLVDRNLKEQMMRMSYVSKDLKRKVVSFYNQRRLSSMNPDDLGDEIGALLNKLGEESAEFFAKLPQSVKQELSTMGRYQVSEAQMRLIVFGQ